MPNDPRHKFKKKMYDMSRNIMYFEERTGGGGTGFPSGGGGGGGGGGNIPWTPVGPVNPINPVNPVNPYGPSPFPIIPTAPFDPYQRKLNLRINELNMKFKRDAQKYYDEAQKPKIVTPKMFDTDVPPSELAGVDILVDAPDAPVSSDLPRPSSRLLAGAKPTPFAEAMGKLPPRINFEIKPSNLLDPTRPSRIPRLLNPKDIIPNALGTPQEQMAAYAEGQAIRDELLGQVSTLEEVEALGRTTLAKRNAKMIADGKSQEYIDAVNKIINDNITAKKLRLETQNLPLEDQLKYAINDIIDPRTPLDEIPALKVNIDELRYELQRKLETNLIEAMDAKAANPTSANKAKVTKLKKELNRMIEQNINYERPEMESLREYQKSLVAEEAEMRSLQERLNELREPTRPREGSLTTQTLEDSLALDKTFEEYQARQAAQLEELQTNARRGGPRPATEATEAEAAGIGGGPSRARPVREVAQGERPPLNETFRTPDSAPPKADQPVRVRDASRPDYLQIGKPKLDFAKMFERTENLLKQAQAHRAKVTSPEEIAQLDRLELTLERALRELGNENPDAYNKAFAPVDLAEEIAETKSFLTTINEEITNAKTPKQVAKLKKVKEKVEQTLKDLKRGKTELYDTGTGKGLSEVSIREFGETMPTTSKIAERLQRIRIVDENISSFLDLPKPPQGSPPASAPSSPPEMELMETTPASRQGLMERLSRANYERVDILDTIDELEGVPSRGGRVSLEEPLELGDLGGIPSRGGRVSTTEVSPPSSGTTTPSSGTRTPIEQEASRTRINYEPLEIDITGPSTTTTRALEPAPKGKLGKLTKGRAKIEPMSRPSAKFNFGRTDLNIQGSRNTFVSSEFMNTNVERLSTSLKGLGARVPTLKAPSINTIKRVGIEGGKIGTGIAVGIGVSYLMAQYFKAHPATDRYSQIGQQYAIGLSGAVAGNIVMRALAMAGKITAKKAFTPAGIKLMLQEAAAATGSAALFVAIQLGTEIGTEYLMDRYKFSHTASKTTAAATGAIAGIGMGYSEGGPFGAVLMAGFGAYSIGAAFFEGQEADKEDAEKRRADAETANKVNTARLQLVRNLKLVDNDYDKAYAMLSPTQKKNINLVGAEAATNFRNSLSVEFNPLEKERNGNPYAPKDPEEDPYEKGFFQFVEYGAPFSPALSLLNIAEKSFQINEAREAEAKNKYYEAYVQWYINKKSEVNPSPPPPEDEGFRLLERDTLGSWRTSAEFSGELVYEQTQNYNRIVNNARKQVLDEWHNNTLTLDELKARDQAGRDIVETAGLDEDFYKDYEAWVIEDATTQLAAQFNHFGTNYRDADQRLVAVASRDPMVLPALDHYYEIMTQLSAETNLPIAELARLDALPKDEQERELGRINALRERVIRGGLLSDKAAVDEFNGNLIREMQSYGDNFEAIMRNINDQQMLMGYSYLYGTNKTDFYRQLHLEAPVVVIPPNPYAESTRFDYDKNRTPYDTLIYGYRYNLTDEQNQELEDYLYNLNRELYQEGDTKGRVTIDMVLERANFIYNRDAPIYRKSDEEVAKENNMTLEEYYAEYGYEMGKIEPPEPIEWKDITERNTGDPISFSNNNLFAGQDESDDALGERQANAAMQQARIEGGGTADEFDRMAAGAYAASQRALVDAQGGNNIAGDQPQPRTNQYGETLREENDPEGP